MVFSQSSLFQTFLQHLTLVTSLSTWMLSSLQIFRTFLTPLLPVQLLLLHGLCWIIMTSRFLKGILPRLIPELLLSLDPQTWPPHQLIDPMVISMRMILRSLWLVHLSPPLLWCSLASLSLWHSPPMSYSHFKLTMFKTELFPQIHPSSQLPCFCLGSHHLSGHLDLQSWCPSPCLRFLHICNRLPNLALSTSIASLLSTHLSFQITPSQARHSAPGLL